MTMTASTTTNYPRIPPATQGSNWSVLFPDYQQRLAAMAKRVAALEPSHWRLAK